MATLVLVLFHLLMLAFLPSPARRLLAAALLLFPLAARAQNVGIGTTQPTQKLDVDGNLRLRGLSGSGLRLPQVQPDGTLTVGSNSLFTSSVTSLTTLDTVRTDNIRSGRVFQPALANGRLYVPAENTLRIYNVQTPGRPVLLGAVRGEFSGVAISTVGGRTLASAFDFIANTLQVFDVTNPAAPALLSTTADAADVGQPGAIVSSGNLLFIPSAQPVSPANARLTIWDISNPASPVRRSLPAVGATDQVAVSGTTLYVGDNDNNLLRILDVSNPTSPVQLSATPVTVYIMGVAVAGTTAYVSGYGGTLHSYDVSTPITPHLLATVPGGGGALAVAGTVAVVADPDNNAVQVFDVSNPAAPVRRGTAPAPFTSLFPPYEYPRTVNTDGSTAFVGIDSGGRVEAFALNTTPPRSVVVGSDGSLGTVAATAQPTLSLSGQTLSISGGNSVTLPGDNLGNHIATQNLNLASYQVVGGTASAPGTSGLSVTSVGNVGIGLGSAAAASRLQVYSPTFDAARLEAGAVGPHLQLTKTGAGSAVVDYIGTDYGTFRAGALELRGVSSVQISGDGDPSSPDVVVAANGNVGIGTGTTAPTARLDVNGAARATAVRSPATGNHNLLPVAYGSVGSGANIFGSTDNFSVSRVPGVPAGAYRLTFSSASGLSNTVLSTSVVTAVLFGSTAGFITYTTGTGTIDVYTFGTNGAAVDRGFSFSIFLP